MCLVLALGHPAVELGETDHGERVGTALQLKQLQQALPHVGHRVVLVRLLVERIVAEL